MSNDNLPTTTTPSALTQLLQDTTRLAELDVDKLDRLLELELRFRAEQARLAFYNAFHALQSEMTPVPKRGKNTHSGALYAKAEDVERMLNPLIARHGFSVSTDTQDSPEPNSIRFTLKLRHIGGHSEEYHMDAEIDQAGSQGKTNKTRIQGRASSFTYCRRQLKCNVFDVTLADDLDGNEVRQGEADGITDDQIHEIVQLVEETQTNPAEFKAFFKVKKVEDLTVRQYAKARQMLNQKKRGQA